MKHESIQNAEPTFNVVNMTFLRDHLVRLKDWPGDVHIGFNMSTYVGDNEPMSAYTGNESLLPTIHLKDWSGHNCSTVACIAGHATILSGMIPISDCSDPDDNIGYFEIAQKWLGLSHKEAGYLFMGEFEYNNILDGLREITLTSTIAELDRILQTGTVFPCNHKKVKSQ